LKSQGGGEKKSNSSGTAADWLFLAMANRRLGHAEEAKKWLTKAQRQMDHAAQEKARDEPPYICRPIGWS